MVRAHLIVKGRVQGVFFRACTRDEADNHDVKGWVKNLFDGSVEVVMEGEDNDVKKVIEWCHKGPPYARVDDVTVEYEPYRGEFHDFRVAR
jgi:acylphosphatase